MCLDTLQTIPEKFKNKTTAHTGWKAFSGSNLNSKEIMLHHIFYGFLPNRPLKINKWLKAKGQLIETTTRTITGTISSKYQAGFHIFDTKKATKLWIKQIFPSRNSPHYRDLVIKKVEFKNVVAIGTQIKGKVYVAKQIRIL